MTLTLLALGLMLPGPAQASKSGGGVVTGGTMTFDPGAPFGSPCGASAITKFRAAAAGVVLDDNPAFYVGPLTFERNDQLADAGTTMCESIASGGGTLDNLMAKGESRINGGEVTCPSLSGTYVRRWTRMQLRLVGDCEINLWQSESVVFIFELQYIPDLEEGSSTVKSAQIAGPFGVLPG